MKDQTRNQRAKKKKKMKARRKREGTTEMESDQVTTRKVQETIRDELKEQSEKV